MRVLHIMNDLRFSGAEVLLNTASRYFLDAGLASTILSTGDTVGEYAADLKEAGYQIVHVPFAKSLSFFGQFVRVLREGQYDVVHCHTERANFWYCLIAKLLGLRVVRTVHNAFPFQGGLRFRRGVERRLLQKIGVVFVACSELVARNEDRKFSIRARVVPNWMDPTRVSLTTAESRVSARIKFGVPNDAFCIVSIGNYVPAKNQEAIVEAVRICASKFEVFYIHCGEGGDALARVSNIHPSEPIKIFGPVKNVGEVLAASDAFVSSSFYEGGPISLLEAARSGTVCITTKVGVAEQFEGIPNVYFAEPTASSLASCIHAAREITPEARNLAGADLSEYVSQNYVPSVGAARYLAIYAGEVAKNVGTRG